ncbi:retron Ec67 family RNA-directed DNA polymerase/endonuclease [Thalassotalea fonticola]|uniref:RNA-directed DNA polymerase n=1 Tax=Thalassotalea fonticola TaxID=3065649 RepID=A0ABZ0GQI6_9GAMM|nr:retron Ec67 family RNA-directed DNA polymerase/endonuclease [Colwelliaceae bacterium S1-1]WOH37666.1 retron Ec67 family RNA-directed DNA polymerase/endonuclease [Colwelliaceae bacterium S1-1]
MGKLEALQKTTTKKQLATLLGIKASIFTYTLYILKPSTQYTQFKIPKKNGGERIISAPNGRLKTIQANLSNLLLDCVDDINKIKYPTSEIIQPTLSHGFVRHRSIITNAMMHLGQKNVLNIDLENFFDSFNFGRVRGFFIKNENFKLDPAIATVIAQIACYNNKLPQGSPSSPVITNLIAHSLDIRLAYLAKKHSCTYSRYADDITFSTRKADFPLQIMRHEEGEYYSSKKLKSEINRAGFSINDKKTRIQYKDSRQDVTGLVVNKKPNTKKEYWRTVRAQCNNLFNTGQFTKTTDGIPVNGNINELEGQLNFIDQIDHYNRLRQKPPLNPKYNLKRDELIKQKKAKQRRYLFSGREKTFSQFLFYQLFYANDKPTMLTEGKTDNVYLKTAINMLASDFPALANVKTATTPYELLLRFVEYSERTKFLLELHGGADYLKHFIMGYESQLKQYKAPKPKQPVIIVIDNDTGPQGLLSYVSNISSATISPTSLVLKQDYRKADFIHIFHNLYVVLTPLGVNDSYTDIEYFFKDIDRLRKYKGKCFNTVTNRDGDKDLSKDAFSKQIVKAQKNIVDFNDLKPLLERIVKATKHFDTIK